MGIRESLEENIPEQKLQDFSLEEQTDNEPKFKLDNLVAPSDWQSLMNSTKECSYDNKVDDFQINLAIALSLINPQELPNLSIDLPKIKGYLEKNATESLDRVEMKFESVDDLIFNLYALKTLFGDEIDVSKYMTHDAWELVIRSLKKRKRKERDYDDKVLEKAFELAVVFPKEFAQEKIINEKERKKIQDIINEEAKENRPIYFLRNLVKARILLPNANQELRGYQQKILKLQKTTAENIKYRIELVQKDILEAQKYFLGYEELKRTRATIVSILHDLVCYRLLINDFENTEKGLQPKPEQKSFQQKTPPRPERREF